MGGNLSAFEVSGKKLWSRAKTTVDSTLYSTNAPSPGYRDLEFDADGETIWAACACDAVDGKPARALVKLDVEGSHDASWRAAADPPRGGCRWSMPTGRCTSGRGSDFLAEFDKGAGGEPSWVRDTSGSVQVVEVMEDKLVIGDTSGRSPTSRTTIAGTARGANRTLIPTTSARPERALPPTRLADSSSPTGPRGKWASTVWCGCCTWKGLGCTLEESSWP